MSRAPTTPGRLSRDRIVAAVTELLERDGVDGVTTRTIGEALDVHPTALYRHFRDMDELLREAADVILADVVVAADRRDDAAEVRDDFDRAASLCREVRSVLMAHPGAARVMSGGPSRMANERAVTERLLALLTSAGVPDADVAPAYHALVEFAVGSAAIDSLEDERSTEASEARHRAWRADYLVASPSDYPATTRFAAQLYPDVESQFEFGLALMISGLRARIDAVS